MIYVWSDIANGLDDWKEQDGGYLGAMSEEFWHWEIQGANIL